MSLGKDCKQVPKPPKPQRRFLTVATAGYPVRPTSMSDPSDHKSDSSHPLLQLCTQTDFNWIGLELPQTGRLDWHKSTVKLMLDPRKDVIIEPTPHVTVLHGFKPEQFEDVKARVTEAKLASYDIVLESMHYKCDPTDTNTTLMWCVDVDMDRSPKLAALIERLKREFPTPTHKQTVPRVTLFEIKYG